ncbi:hypothetical protein SCUCBS95973_009479 [Sporothrix curviconia]|uniref:Uncharacterized protein n=1 Tax=Sporothrix curviconia TaxID=1260050 RepID=A0ABP0CV92_9PEZI
MEHKMHTAPAAAGCASSAHHRRNSSLVSTASSIPSVEISPLAASPSTFRQDPLAALERGLLARPSTHRYWHHRHHSHSGSHLAPPSPLYSRGQSRSRSHGRASPSPSGRSPSHSPSPTPAARRCMEATAAWTPRMDRRQSWDDQDHRHAMMLQSTGLLDCACHPGQHEANGGQCPSPTPSHGLCFSGHHHRHHSRHQSETHSGSATSQSIYEADRGFSEVLEARP